MCRPGGQGCRSSSAGRRPAGLLGWANRQISLARPATCYIRYMNCLVVFQVCAEAPASENPPWPSLAPAVACILSNRTIDVFKRSEATPQGWACPRMGDDENHNQHCQLGAAGPAAERERESSVNPMRAEPTNVATGKENSR